MNKSLIKNQILAFNAILYQIISILFFAIISGCAQEKMPLLGETEWQKQMNSDFKDASKSLL